MKRAYPLALLCLVAAFDVWFIAGHIPDKPFGDEWRYLFYANNLLHGEYSPTERVFLWNGPGYPILLMPFVKADWLNGARYLNALLHCGSLVYAWLIARIRLPARQALACVAVLALYLPIYEHLPLLYTELLCFFLVSGWIYHSLSIRRSWVHIVVAGVFLGVLCLTKVAFGYPLLAWSLGLSIAFAINRKPMLRAHLQQAALAFALCVPYLTYTYELTGRPLYWSSAAGNSFYWLSSPFKNEWGDWYHQGWVSKNKVLRAHHKKIFDRTTGLDKDPTLSEEEQVFNLSTPESADIFTKQALKNVRKRPLKFLRNWLGNLVRLLFDVPVTVRKVALVSRYSVSHLVLLLGTVGIVVRAVRDRRPMPTAWLPIAAFALLSLGAYSLSSAVARFMIPLVPFWWLGACSLLPTPSANPEDASINAR